MKTDFNEDGSIIQDSLKTLLSFFIIFVGSFLIGSVSALIISYLLKRQARGNDSSAENINVAMMVLCPWVSYLIAEGLEMSGIVAILVNGVFLHTYGAPNLSSQSKRVLKMGFETAAYSCETLVFLFLGIGIFAFAHPFKESLWLVLLTIVILNVSRFFNIGITSIIVNCFRKKRERINCRT